MTKFERIFGIPESEVKKTCIIAPLVNKVLLGSLGVKSLKKGVVYSCGHSKKFTLINTGMGCAFTGDAVLYLGESGCKKAYLLGGCGSTGALDIGSICIPSVAYSDESFSDSLNGKNDIKAFYPDKTIFETLAHKENIKTVVCQTVSSLKLEDAKIRQFKYRGVDVMDMECSAFFSAAKYSRIKAAALFYVTDILLKKPFFEPLEEKDKKIIDSAVGQIAGLLDDND